MSSRFGFQADKPDELPSLEQTEDGKYRSKSKAKIKPKFDPFGDRRMWHTDLKYFSEAILRGTPDEEKVPFPETNYIIAIVDQKTRDDLRETAKRKTRSINWTEGLNAYDLKQMLESPELGQSGIRKVLEPFSSEDIDYAVYGNKNVLITFSPFDLASKDVKEKMSDLLLAMHIIGVFYKAKFVLQGKWRYDFVQHKDIDITEDEGLESYFEEIPKVAAPQIIGAYETESRVSPVDKFIELMGRDYRLLNGMASKEGFTEINWPEAEVWRIATHELEDLEDFAHKPYTRHEHDKQEEATIADPLYWARANQKSIEDQTSQLRFGLKNLDESLREAHKLTPRGIKVKKVIDKPEKKDDAKKTKSTSESKDDAKKKPTTKRPVKKR